MRPRFHSIDGGRIWARAIAPGRAGMGLATDAILSARTAAGGWAVRVRVDREQRGLADIKREAYKPRSSVPVCVHLDAGTVRSRWPYTIKRRSRSGRPAARIAGRHAPCTASLYGITS